MPELESCDALPILRQERRTNGLMGGVLLVAFLLLTTGSARAQGAATEADRADLPALRTEIKHLATNLDSGAVGVGVIHLESGQQLYWNRDERFPMASTFKVPIAVRLLERVDRGELSLDSLIALQPSDQHPGSGKIEPLLHLPGAQLSVRNITELMLRISDNSATDIALELASGPDAVNGKMRRLGVEDLQVNRSTLELIADFLGVKKLSQGEAFDLEAFEDTIEAMPAQEREAAAEAFSEDQRDTSSPAAMAQLLAKIWRSEGLSQESTDLLLDIMRRCETGENRLKGMLPEDVEVMHKTGTIGGTLNDVGIIELPHDAGHVVTVVFTKESEAESKERAETVAQIARAIYDHFLFTQTPAD